MAAFDTHPKGFWKPPVIVSEPITIEARAGSPDEAAMAKIVRSVCGYETDYSRKERLDLIEELESFLTGCSSSKIVDDVHRCLGFLYGSVHDQNPERPGHDLDWSLRAKGVEHHFSISPSRRSISAGHGKTGRSEVP
jgi:hypothetical protein